MSELIQNVSDTSLWVAHYRAVESDRPDAIFRDRYAKTLVGERGPAIARDLVKTGRFTQWVVTMRTVIIDRMIQDLIKEGVDTFVNLGAGMDTRPYRMNLPKSVRWVEVDFPHIIQHKEKILQSERPTCDLRRYSLDLAQAEKRRAMLTEIAGSSSRIAVLTEGVIPYLSPAEVENLAKDLLLDRKFEFWITEYMAPQTYIYLKNPKRMRAMKNAPFRFFPEDWFGFFNRCGWERRDLRFYSEIAQEFARPSPTPWPITWAFRLFSRLKGKAWIEQQRRLSGYALFSRREAGREAEKGNKH